MPEETQEPELASFYTLTAGYGRLLQLGGRSIKVGTAPGKPVRLTASQVAQAAGAGVVATPVSVTTESRPLPAEDAAAKVFPSASDNPRSGKVFDPTAGRGTRPGPFIPPDVAVAELNQSAEKEQ